MNVVVAGSLNFDLVVHLDRMPNPGETVAGEEIHTYPGGKGLNQAVSVARSNVRANMIGALGDDPNSVALFAVLKSEGINSDQIQRVAGACGTAIIEVDKNGQNRIVVIPGANDALNSRALPKTYFQDFSGKKILLCQLESPVAQIIKVIEIAKSSGFLILLNPAPAMDLTRELLSMIDILIPNQHESEILTGIKVLNLESARLAALKLIGRGVQAVIVTLGDVGALYISKEEEIFQSAFTVDPIDTTAAGDAFCGAFAAELARGKNSADALQYACAAGALATTKKGAVQSIPREIDIRALVGSQVS